MPPPLVYRGMHAQTCPPLRTGRPVPMNAPPDTPHILLVEDDAEIGTMLSRFLTDHGLRVTRLTDGRGIDRTLAAGRVDLVVLDVMLPGEDGLAICRRLRGRSTVPIIMLTALGSETDRIVGLEMGADDYLPKPFSPRELLARIRAVLRRGQIAEAAQTDRPVTMTFDDWRLDTATRQLFDPQGVRVPLTSGEFNLLAVFCQHARKVLSREQLLDLLHGRAAAVFDRSIDIQVSRLRRKIEPDPRDPTLIKTVRYGGYMFTPKVTLTGEP